MRPEDLTDLSRFLEELQTESDRGLALVGASVLDDKVRATLASFFVECRPASRLLEVPNAPLGAFSARADLCLALGLVDQFEHTEISLIRKIRNEFAHGLHGTNFQSERIAAYCSSGPYSLKYYQFDARGCDTPSGSVLVLGCSDGCSDEFCAPDRRRT